MLSYLSEKVIAPFLRDELVDRICRMLGFFLSQLVGSKTRTEIAVENREKYSFDPKKLLGTLIDIYLNFWKARNSIDISRFLQGISKDARCYDNSNFVSAKEIIERTQIRSKSVCDAIIQLSKAIIQNVEIDIDIPDEYADPLTGEFMDDPVRLPSGTNINRSSIVQHLLNKETDPFTNLPLTIDQVVPCK